MKGRWRELERAGERKKRGESEEGSRKKRSHLTAMTLCCSQSDPLHTRRQAPGPCLRACPHSKASPLTRSESNEGPTIPHITISFAIKVHHAFAPLEPNQGSSHADRSAIRVLSSGGEADLWIKNDIGDLKEVKRHPQDL